MDVVILCGGKGTRMGELTKEIPKPLIKIGDKTLIEHKLDVLPKNIKRVFIVVGYLKEKIIEHVSKLNYPQEIIFIEQKEQLGTAHALHQVKDLIGQDFISMAGDDIYMHDDILKMSEMEWGWGLMEKSPRIGYMDIKQKVGYLSGSQLVDGVQYNPEIIGFDTGMYKLKKVFFSEPMALIKEGGKEFGTPHTIIKFAEHTKTPIKIHTITEWEMINSPEDVERAKKLFE